ncbi:hypothetical protein, partial [Roseovarius sp.]|uniref:hypothetical protein n=1 Tax=Roseovarius sp. TaxID=1486281 RepID=UPI00356A41F8
MLENRRRERSIPAAATIDHNPTRSCCPRRIGKNDGSFPANLKHAERFNTGQRRVSPIRNDRQGENLTHHRVGFLQAREPIREVGIHRPRRGLHGVNGR